MATARFGERADTGDSLLSAAIEASKTVTAPPWTEYSFRRTKVEGSLSDETLAAQFAKFDTDQSGFIESHELEAVVKHWASSTGQAAPSTREMLEFADADGDGRISRSEFIKIMRYVPPKTSAAPRAERHPAHLRHPSSFASEGRQLKAALRASAEEEAVAQAIRKSLTDTQSGDGYADDFEEESERDADATLSSPWAVSTPRLHAVETELAHVEAELAADSQLKAALRTSWVESGPALPKRASTGDVEAALQTYTSDLQAVEASVSAEKFRVKEGSHASRPQEVLLLDKGGASFRIGLARPLQPSS
jgi:hypothetical protein